MGFRSRARVTKSRSIARVVAPPTPQIFSPTGASLVIQGGQVVAGGVTVSPTGAQLVTQGGTVVYGGINARPTGASLVTQGGTPAFTLFDQTHLVAWYAARTIVGLNDGDSITSLTDLSGSGNDLPSHTGTNVLYKTAIVNGYPVMRFDGGGRITKAGGVITAAPTTVIATVNFASLAAADNSICGNSKWKFGALGSGTNKIRFTTIGVKDYTATPVLSTATWYTIAAVFDAGFDVAFYFGGSFSSTVAGTADMGAGGATFGVGAIASLAGIVGDIAEVMVFDTDLDATNVGYASKFLYTYYGV